VFRAIRDAHDAAAGIVRAQITVAKEIGEHERKMIEAAIAARTGRTVRTHVDLDPKILGGFIARAGSQIFDGSVAASIRRFQTQVEGKAGA